MEATSHLVFYKVLKTLFFSLERVSFQIMGAISSATKVEAPMALEM
jgi:hypothetical protein